SRCGELGFLGLKFPEEYGGQGGTHLHDAIWVEGRPTAPVRRWRWPVWKVCWSTSIWARPAEEVDRLIAEGEDILGEDTTKGHCVGCGGENEVEKGDYFWSGSFLKSGVYYVRVQHTPCRCEPAYYQLLVSGTSVSY
ncbi:MAG: acyl-CoA dehydrogenase family protein, partial [Caldilinea sp.]